jgi:hypothetical protein
MVNLPLKNRKIMALLIVLFILSGTVTFLAINYSHFGYSVPAVGSPQQGSNNGIAVSVGPVNNAADVPLETAIVVTTFRNPAVSNLKLTPETSIKNVVNVPDLQGETTFYLNEPLKPATTYNVSVLVGDETITWSFITTSQPLTLQTQISNAIATYSLVFSLLIAAIVTLFASIIITKRKSRPNAC